MTTIDEYLERPYHIELVRDQSEDSQVGWVASVVELPGCLSQASTAEEAASRIREAMAEWFGSMLERGADIPEPSPEPAFGGKIMLRVPASLHERLVWEANREGVSLNQFLVGVAAAAVGWRLSPGQPMRGLGRTADDKRAAADHPAA